MGLETVPLRQLDVGPAGWFQPLPTSPPANQVLVKKGFAYSGGSKVLDRYTAGDQLSPGGFASVTAGNVRWDLVYLDLTGAVQVAVGTQVSNVSPVYTGAPGFTGGPDLPDGANPVAYVKIDETGTPVISSADITPINGFMHIGKHLRGHYVDKGALGSAPTGASTNVSALFASETNGGSTTARGVVTTAPDNVVELLDHNFKEIIHVQDKRIFGRLTWAGGVWTLTYFYMSDAGVETAVTNIDTESQVVPTNLRLYRVPKVYSLHESARPLFGDNSNTQRRHVRPTSPAGQIPVGGMVEFVPDTVGTPPPLPFGFEWCDGTVVAAANSRKVGHPKPTRMKTAGGGAKRFGMGVDLTAGAFGGATAITHGGLDTAAGHGHTVNAHNHGAGGSISGSTSNESGHTHTVPNTPDSVDDGAYGGNATFGLAGNLAFPAHAHHHAVGPTNAGNAHAHNFSGVNFSIANDTPGTDSQGGHDNKPLHAEVAVLMRVL
jgi:hypothetical protein